MGKEYYLRCLEMNEKFYKDTIIFSGSIYQCREQYWYHVNRLFNLKTEGLTDLIAELQSRPGIIIDEMSCEYKYFKEVEGKDEKVPFKIKYYITEKSQGE